MDLIGQLASNLGISPESAQGAVGSLLTLVKQHAPAEAFAEVEAKAPETSQWMAAAASPTAAAPADGGGGLLGSLLGGLGGAAGPLGALVTSLSQHGLNGEALGTLVPLVMQFLHAKIGQEGVAKLLASVPFLSHLVGNTGASQAPAAGGLEAGLESALGGALGSLFK